MSEQTNQNEAAGGQSTLTDGLDAGSIAPSIKRYRVTYLHDHKTLKTGDVVVMTESPKFDNLLLREPDMTLHFLQDNNGQYVHMVEAHNAGFPLD